MGTFAIYAIVLTVVYLLYMTVTIAIDLYGKKGQKKNDLEVIIGSDDTGSDSEDVAQVVSETDGGYAIGEDSPSAGFVETGEESDDEDNGSDDSEESGDDNEDEEVEQAEQPVDEEDDSAMIMEESLAEQAMYDNYVKDMQAQMEPVRPEYQHQYNSEDFAFIMAQPMNKVTKITRRIINMV